MRVSVRQNDVGYHPMAQQCEVFLNGEKLNHCFTADEEKGEARCYAEDESGKPFLDPDKPDSAKEIVLKGRVRVVVPSGFLKK